MNTRVYPKYYVNYGSPTFSEWMTRDDYGIFRDVVVNFFNSKSWKSLVIHYVKNIFPLNGHNFFNNFGSVVEFMNAKKPLEESRVFCA